MGMRDKMNQKGRKEYTADSIRMKIQRFLKNIKKF